MTEVPWWSQYVAVAALVVSIGFNVWQAWDRRRERRPDVTVEADNMIPGSPSWPGPREGQHSGNDRIGVYLAGRVHVTGTATVVAAGMAPRTGKRGWAKLADAYARVEGADDHATLPRTVTNGALLVRVEQPHPLPPGITQDGGTRLWVRTSRGHKFVSTATTEPLGERYRGPK